MYKNKSKPKNTNKHTQIKFWKFQYTSSNFWITVFCLLLIFILCMTGTICYTVYKVQELKINSNKIQNLK